jgi:protein TonB
MITLPELPPPSTEAEKMLIRARLAAPSARKPKPTAALQLSRVPPRSLDLSKSFLDSHRMPGKTRSSTVGYSIVLHALLLAAVLLVPMWFADTLDVRTFTRTLLVAPPPPPAIAAPSAAAVRSVASSVPLRQITAKGHLLLPTYIPKEVAMINEPQVAPEVGAEPKVPLRVGGSVKPPRILQRVDPDYPILALNAQIQGNVVISAIIDAQGNVVQMKVVSGHVLLIEAAMNALKKWKFEPTIFDGEPVPLSWDVTITFRLD